MTTHKDGGHMYNATAQRAQSKLDAAPSSSRSHGTHGSNAGSTDDGNPSGTERLNTYSLQRLLDCFSILRDATGNQELQMQTAVLFVFIASRYPNEIPQGEAAQRLNMEQTTTSRNFAYLAKGSYSGLGGYKLIEVFEDPFYRRRKLCKLTPKGLEVAQRLVQALVV